MTVDQLHFLLCSGLQRRIQGLVDPGRIKTDQQLSRSKKGRRRRRKIHMGESQVIN